MIWSQLTFACPVLISFHLIGHVISIQCSWKSSGSFSDLRLNIILKGWIDTNHGRFVPNSFLFFPLSQH